MYTDPRAFSEGQQGQQPVDLKVPITTIAAGLRVAYGDPSYDLDDAEAIAMCLIDQVRAISCISRKCTKFLTKLCS